MNECKSEGPDHITRTDLVPDAETNSADSMVYQTAPGPVGYVPVPQEAYAITYIDVDADFVNDFVFVQRHYYINYSPTDAAMNYQTEKTVTGTTHNDVLVSAEDSGIVFLDSLAPIQPGAAWKKQVKLEHSIPGSGAGNMPAEPVYIGVRMIRNEKIYLGWIRLKGEKYNLKIQSYGMNHTACNTIRAGE